MGRKGFSAVDSSWGPAGSQPGFFTTIAARERKGLKIQSAPSIDDAGTPGGMLRDVSEYTLAIQPAMLPQQIVVRNPG